MRVSCKLILFLLAWLFLSVQVRAQELPLTHFTPDREVNPLPAAGVTDVYQDREGYLWLAVLSAGLVRYDGHSMESYGPSEGLVDVNAEHLIEDASGYLWVASPGGLVVSKEPLGAYENGRRVQFAARWGR